jgi:hypothetical protein
MPTTWTIPADGSQITETYGYRTDVMSAFDGTEQRVKMHSRALEAIEFTFLTALAEETGLFKGALFAGQGELFTVPLWQYGSRLTADVAPASVLLPIVDALVVPYRVGQVAVLWAGISTFEVAVVSAVGGAGVSVAPIIGSWPAGTLVFPARAARIADRVAMSNASNSSLSSIRFKVEPT